MSASEQSAPEPLSTLAPKQIPVRSSDAPTAGGVPHEAHTGSGSCDAPLADQETRTAEPLNVSEMCAISAVGENYPVTEAATNQTTALPQHIGQYEITRELGRGAMGIVYEARQAGLNRTVALKMILTQMHAGAEELVRFRAEAEAVARLQHPNIVQIYEIGERDGLPFFSQEYLSGGTLARKLKSEPQPPRQAADLLRTLSQAVADAHQHGIVHRDLKPGNVLLAADGTPKITDFGLAKRLDVPAIQTATGMIMGTPSYMAPEQAEGHVHDISPATDVYALGGILYETLTGRPPFKAPNALDTIQQVISEEPVPPSRLQSKIPHDLETICLKCLRKDQAKRYPNAGALADDLDRFLNDRPIYARRVPLWEQAWLWMKRWPTRTVIIVLALLTVTRIVVQDWWDARKLRDLEQKSVHFEQQALTAYHRLAETQVAHGDLAAFAATAQDCLALAPVDARNLYVLARDYAMAAQHRGHESEYAPRALELLSRAQAAGYFRDPANREQLQKDTAFDALRQRSDFQQWFQSLER